EVIINEDSLVPTVVIDDVIKPATLLSADQKLAKRNELKARVSAANSVSVVCAQLPVSSHPNIDSLSNAIIFSFFDRDFFRRQEEIWVIIELQLWVLICPKWSAITATERDILLENVDLLRIQEGLVLLNHKEDMSQIQLSGEYHAVPPPIIGNFMPPKPDLVFHTPPIAIETSHSAFTVQLSLDESKPNDPQSAPSFVQTFEHVKPSGHFGQPIEAPILDATPKPTSSKTNGSSKRKNRKTCFVCRSVDHLIKDCNFHKTSPKPRNYAHRGYNKQYASFTKNHPQKHIVPAVVLTKSKLVSITAVRPVSSAVPNNMVSRPRHAYSLTTRSKSPFRRHLTHSQSPKTSNSHPKVIVAKAPVVSAAKGKKRKWGNPQYALKDKGVIDSGCSWHMTGNMSYLFDFQELNVGYVAFRGNPKGGKISSKGKIKTDSLLPIPFWAEAVNTACYVQNRVLVNKPQNKTPYELLHGRTPSTGPTWLFDIDSLTRTMNYQPIIAGNQSNPSVGFQEEIDAEKAGEEATQQYPLFPVWSTGSSKPQNKEGDAAFDDYASFMGFMVYQMDVKSAFLYGTIEEEVYVCQPLGFEDPNHPDKVYKVVKRTDRSNTLHQEEERRYTTCVNLFLEKKVVVTEAAIRDVLHLDDAEGIDCLPNEEIFTALAHMGYEKSSTKLTFYIAFFSSQWKFLIHTILQSMSAKRTSWNEFSSALALAVICLSIGHKFNFSKYIFESLQRNVDSSSKFYMYPRVGKGCSRVETPLFEGMLVAREPEEQGNAEEQGNDDNAAEEPVTAVDDEALDTCVALARQVEHLEHDKVAQDLKIIKLKTRVKKLEKTNKGRMIDELDKDEGAELMNEKDETKEVKDITGDAQVEGRQAEIYQINMDHVAKVLNMQEDEPEVHEVVEVVKTAKLIIEVVAVVSETVSVVDVVQAVVPAATVTPAPVKSKDKEKGIMVEEPKPIKKKQQVEMDEAYARKLHKELNQDIDWEVAIDHVKQKAKENPYVQRYQKKKKRPQTEAQARRNMMVYLKNTAGFRLDYFKGMSYDDIRPIFDAKFNANMDFLLKSKEQMEEEESRPIVIINETPAQKAAKRRRLNKEAEDVEELKQYLEIVPDEDDDVYTEATPLARKVPVVDYPIMHVNNKPRYKIIKVDGTHQMYGTFVTMLKNFDRDDLETLWSIVKESFGVDAAIELKEKHQVFTAAVKTLVLPGKS
nr:putative ribonuclease H-like domain-containing protein [Tanacetum cinerariifolium]